MSAANQTAAQQARILLEFFGPNGERWCQHGTGAKTKGGFTTGYTNSNAHFLCVTAAAQLFFDEDRHTVFKAMFPEAGDESGMEAVRFNDSNPWEVVKQKLEEIAGS